MIPERPQLNEIFKSVEGEALAGMRYVVQVITMSLRGYVFFGSSVKILNDVKQHLGQLQVQHRQGCIRLEVHRR